MKRTTLLACFLFATHFMYCQEATLATGAETTGSGDLSCCSIGQFFHSHYKQQWLSIGK